MLRRIQPWALAPILVHSFEVEGNSLAHVPLYVLARGTGARTPRKIGRVCRPITRSLLVDDSVAVYVTELDSCASVSNGSSSPGRMKLSGACMANAPPRTARPVAECSSQSSMRIPGPAAPVPPQSAVRRSPPPPPPGSARPGTGTPGSAGARPCLPSPPAD